MCNVNVYICCNNDGTFSFYAFGDSIAICHGSFKDMKNALKRYKKIGCIEYFGVDESHKRELDKLVKNHDS